VFGLLTVVIAAPFIVGFIGPYVPKNQKQAKRRLEEWRQKQRRGNIVIMDDRIGWRPHGAQACR
jgi:hypothetical protein